MKEFMENRLKIKRKVLVVDDEAVNRKMLEKMLEGSYEILEASNGREALTVILDNQDTLSLVLLDLLMPVMDGYELLSLIENDVNLKHIPVIVLTSEKSAEVKSLNMGAADFIPKPYDLPEVILARVNKTIQLYENINIVSATQYDELTSLFNREFFMEYCTVIDQYYPDTDMDAVVININRFHVLNEMYGRPFGDELLKKIAASVKGYVRENRGIACRYHADMFYIYMPHTDYIEEIFRQIVTDVSDKLEDAGGRIRVGIYPRVNRRLDIHRRMDCALLACNSIKGKYNAHIAYYDSEMREKEAYAERLMADMEKALSEKQFVVYYQPKMAIQEGVPHLTSAEALIRWQHPELGMISPGHFIPLFEENGMIRKLDRYVWREAAAQVAAWKNTYGITIPVSVNVSRIDMLEPGFIDEIMNIVKEAGITPDEYMLEVTESAYTEDSDRIIEVVNDLRSAGFRIEMDDFGTGYSSLNMLSSLPIDVLKLDMRFIRNIHTNPKDLRMVVLIMDIAEYLNLTVVAEGVEFKEQYELLRQAGVHVIQGFYFSKPVHPDRFSDFIKERIEYDNSREA